MQNPLSDLAFQKIQNLSRRPQTRSLLFEPCLYIDHRRSIQQSRGKPSSIYPDWWPHENYVAEKPKERKQKDVTIPVPKKNPKIAVKRRTVQDALAEAQGTVEEDGWVWKFPKKMVDENTQTDAIINLDTHPTPKAEINQSKKTIWIPLSEDSKRVNSNLEANVKPRKHDSSLKATLKNHSIEEEYKHQTSKIKTGTESTLLEICTKFLSSPILQILDLSVLELVEDGL